MKFVRAHLTSLLLVFASCAHAKGISVPQQFLGKWALAPEKNEACNPESGPAEVTADNMQTYHEDFCKITGVKEIKGLADPRTEISCIASGEGGPETKQREVWRIRDLFGKHLFIEQTLGGLTFWQKCPHR